MFGGLQVTPPPLFHILTSGFNDDLACPMVPVPLRKIAAKN
jgi:hypothetical protein